MEIYDVHAHLLPGMDDGPSSMEEAAKMLEAAERQGITNVFVTPHFSPRFLNMDPDRIKKKCAELAEYRGCMRGQEGDGKASEKRNHGHGKEPIKLWTGQEITYSSATLRLLDEGKLLTLADSNYILIEFHPAVSYSEIFKAVRLLRIEGYRPVIAHVERYSSLREEDRVEELSNQGAYIQMNYRSVGGKWRESTTRWCRRLLKDEQVHFLGTDMHNMQNRKPETEEALRWMESHLDKKYLDRILCTNAKKIIQNTIIF